MANLSSVDVKRICILIGIFNGVINKALVKSGLVGLTKQTLLDAAEDAIKHHAAFVDKFINQKSVDPYKILSWYGFFLSKKADDPDKNVLFFTITHLNDLLCNEHLALKLSSQQVEHLYKMAKLDGLEDEFGIGKNGVYSVFSSCIDMVSNYPLGSKIIASV